MAYRPIGAGNTKNRRFTFFIVGVILVVALLVLGYMLLFTDTFQGEQFDESTIPITATMAIADDKVYYMEGTTLVCADELGEVLWTHTVSGSSLDLAASEQVVCVYSEKSAVAINPEGHTLFNVAPSDFSIEDVSCGQSSVAFYTSTTDGKEYIRTIDLAGVQIDSHELTENVLQFGLSTSSDNLWMLSLSTSGVTPVSQIITRSPLLQSTMGTLPVSSQLISKVFMTDEHMILSGTTSHMVYNNNGGDKVSEDTIYGLYCVDSQRTEEDYNFLYTLTNSAEENYVARIITLNSGIDTLIQLPEGVREMIVSQSYLYCFADDKITVYDFTGKFIEEINLPSITVKKLSSSALVQNEDGVFSLPLE